MDVNATDKHGNNALWHAVKRKDNMDLIAMLIAFGVDPKHENKDRVSPLKLARDNNQTKVAGILEKS